MGFQQGPYNQQGQWRSHLGNQFNKDQGGPSNRPLQQGPNIFQRTTKLEETLALFMQVTMSNHKSTESALKNLEIQVGQLAKQLAEKSSSSFGANTEKNPKEECKSIMIRSRKLVAAEDEDDTTIKKRNGVTDEKSQWGDKPIIVGKEEIKDNEKEIEGGKQKLKEEKEKVEKNKEEKTWNQYSDNILDRRILPERNVKIYHTEFNEFKAELERHNLHKRLTNLQDGSIDLALVKEFYANLYSLDDQSPKQVKVRGHLIRIDADSLNTFLETPVVLEEGETLPTYSWFSECRGPSLSNSSRLGFAALITTLCRARGVTSNSLTYESLSLAINSAYIKKNCWNKDYLTLSYPNFVRGPLLGGMQLVFGHFEVLGTHH
ncbi:hypothetical protein HKD37_06G016688 [Glycine soja]